MDTRLSATALLLPFAYEENWYRGEEYADKKLVRLNTFDGKAVTAKAHGASVYFVRLRFAGPASGGSLARDCSCPYVGGDVCKHMAAVAILWDEKRGIPRPTKAMVAADTIAPPLVSMTQITTAWKQPLEADLEVVRLAASERGRHSRVHLRLPLRPPLANDPRKSLTVSEVKRAFREIVRWTRRAGYDEYLCGGELEAAFCELLRVFFRRADASHARVLADILLEGQIFHEQMQDDLIDLRDGVDVFGTAHLDELYRVIDKQTKKLNAVDRKAVLQKLAIFDDRAE
ncbi:MAG: hypothetical protein COV10_01015 [Candidatus Vogelbacteria bacterium CG10_big_fil_rev_8_21_14_0_10_51_16]|uniref:SWIM-type domain-containing protein n=1 Tax=Candidatus Vogelbacteria bacterium CG10_big_fil_rev_8_21_14_0_10_51_16 TaxID=1975045 RepID=A0A2H0REW5_9BACT|nr:MAG: hypothetical protein COV10_01015 [Candidatus Vogelbacteria bacterium CG10_big_fil_rev_8_21_14_0_10_51_16]